MSQTTNNKFSAAEQGLGYMYQPRFALLKLLQLPESTSVLIEVDDDLDFVDEDGVKTLASLKHKAIGDKVTDLSTDFWKSVRIWLDHFNHNGLCESQLRFFLFTTSKVSESSFLIHFLNEKTFSQDDSIQLSQLASEVLEKTKSKPIQAIALEFNKLNSNEKEDFLKRITIFDDSARITDVPEIIKTQCMRSVRREYRDAIYERIEGWWTNLIVRLLAGEHAGPISGYEISDKFSAFAEEYKADNLPITVSGKSPPTEIDPESDPRCFVVQLRAIGIASSRIRNAILDYYRAFEQRSVWARENLLISDELEEYEDRLVDEWGRYRDVVFEELDEKSAETVLLEAGKALYKWADLESGNSRTLRIRERVTEPFVLRGGFHILANERPLPRVHWHPHFLARIHELMGSAA